MSAPLHPTMRRSEMELRSRIQEGTAARASCHRWTIRRIFSFAGMGFGHESQVNMHDPIAPEGVLKTRRKVSSCQLTDN
jgi:hypothetical protein